MIRSGESIRARLTKASLLAPAGTPAANVKRLQDELAKTLRDAVVRDRLLAMAVTPETGNAGTFAKTIAIETELGAGVAKAANVLAEQRRLRPRRQSSGWRYRSVFIQINRALI